MPHVPRRGSQGLGDVQLDRGRVASAEDGPVPEARTPRSTATAWSSAISMHICRRGGPSTTVRWIVFAASSVTTFTESSALHGSTPLYQRRSAKALPPSATAARRSWMLAFRWLIRPFVGERYLASPRRRVVGHGWRPGRRCRAGECRCRGCRRYRRRDCRRRDRRPPRSVWAPVSPRVRRRTGAGPACRARAGGEGQGEGDEGPAEREPRGSRGRSGVQHGRETPGSSDGFRDRRATVRRSRQRGGGSASPLPDPRVDARFVRRLPRPDRVAFPSR